MSEEHNDEERRKNAWLTDEQIDAIRERILASVYEDIGRSLVKKILWVVGSLLIALLAWAISKGYLKP